MLQAGRRIILRPASFSLTSAQPMRNKAPDSYRFAPKTGIITCVRTSKKSNGGSAWFFVILQSRIGFFLIVREYLMNHASIVRILHE